MTAYEEAATIEAEQYRIVDSLLGAAGGTLLYIEGEISRTWPVVARQLSDRELLRMVVQTYHTDVPPPPFPASTSPQWLETVTTFDGETRAPASSEAVDVDADLLQAVSELDFDALEDELDFALFRPGERRWLAAAVPHEGMVLVRDDSLEDDLAEAGLLVTSEPPDGW